MVLRDYTPMKAQTGATKSEVYKLAPTVYGKREQGVLCPDTCFGFREKDGRFSSAEGMKKTTAFTLSRAERCYDANGLVAFANGGLYALSGAGFTLKASFSAAPSVCAVTLESGEEGYLFYRGNDWWYKGASEKRLVGVNAKFACFHYERLYVWDGETLRFSAACNPFDWNEDMQGAGWAELPCPYGDVVSMCAFSERVYLVRERGVTVFRAFGDNRNMKAVHVGLPCKQIVGESVVPFADGMLFFSEGNLYRYDGADCSLLLETEFAVQEAAFDGKRYLARGTLGGENVLFVYRQDGTHSFFRIDVTCLSARSFLSEGRWLTLSDEEEEPVERVWSAELIPLSSAKKKRVRRIYLFGKGEVSLRISSAFGTREKTVQLPALVRPSLHGSEFSLRILAHGIVGIDKMEVKFLEN
ncbi:MAG: hypothetical protein J5993_01465 [Clostridia bacterium]|nr:hypothetical protein [Clostridia bacterium]